MSKIVEGIAKDLKSIPEKFKAKTGNVDKKKLLLMNLPYVLAGYFCDKIAWLWRVSPGQDASAKMMAVMAGMEDLFSNPLPSFYPKDLLIGAGCGIALRLVVYLILSISVDTFFTRISMSKQQIRYNCLSNGFHKMEEKRRWNRTN